MERRALNTCDARHRTGESGKKRQTVRARDVTQIKESTIGRAFVVRCVAQRHAGQHIEWQDVDVGTGNGPTRLFPRQCTGKEWIP